MLTWLSVKIKFLLPLCFSIWLLDYSLLGKGKRKGQRWLLSCMRDFFPTSFKTMIITRAAFPFCAAFCFSCQEPHCCYDFFFHIGVSCLSEVKHLLILDCRWQAGGGQVTVEVSLGLVVLGEWMCLERLNGGGRLCRFIGSWWGTSPGTKTFT